MSSRLGVGRSAFDTQVERYDAWYDTPGGQALFASEVACLRPLLHTFPRPYLEVGVGTGRFAQALRVEHGLDPSRAAIRKARGRGVQVVRALGERLPFRDGSFGGVLVAFTLCFVEDPARALREVRRVLASGGGLVLGVMLKGTPWAEFYAQKGRDGHPLYSSAHFYDSSDVEVMLLASNLRPVACSSTLLQPPGLPTYRLERPVSGCAPETGFVGIAAVAQPIGS